MIRKPDGAPRPANGTPWPRLAPAAGLLLAALAVPAARADVVTPIISGLAWRSGSTIGGLPCIADLRGRALDAVNVYLAPPSFPQMVKNAGAWVQRYGSKAPLLVVSMALVPKDNKGQFAQCATGAFDGYFRQIGADLQPSPAMGIVVRLGWEANLGSKVAPLGGGQRRPGRRPTGVLAARRPGAQGRRPAAAARVDQLEEDAATGRCTCSGRARATPGCTRATTWSTSGARTSTTPGR